MNLEKVIAVSGLPGLYELITTRNNGLLIANFDTKKTKFCSIRKHQFTPLETVSIYTLEDTAPLKVIFRKMFEHPPIPHNSENHELQEYFDKILPNYDEDKVYPKDMKKVIKWFNFLVERKLISAADLDQEE